MEAKELGGEDRT